MKIFYGYLATYSYLITILIIFSILHKKKKIKDNTSRKLVHILVGFSWIIMIYFFKTSIHLVIPPLSFMFLNYYSYRKNLIKCMEKRNKSKGTIYYALSFTILAFLTYLNPKFLTAYGIGVLTMALGDGIAPFLGSKFPKNHIGATTKTYIGSFAIFLIAIILSLIFNNIYMLQFRLIDYIIIGLSASLLELIGDKYDNLTLPIGLSLISYLLI